MSGYFQKNPSRGLTLRLDWACAGLREGETIERDLGWSIYPMQGSISDLKVITPEINGRISKASLIGGMPSKTYFATASVRTDQRRDLTRSVVVRVSSKKEDQR